MDKKRKIQITTKIFESSRLDSSVGNLLFEKELRTDPNFLSLSSFTCGFLLKLRESKLGEDVFIKNIISHIHININMASDILLINFYISRISNMINDFLSRKKNNNLISFSEISELQSYKETVINLMKRTIDYIIMLSYIKIEKEKFKRDLYLKVDSYGLFKRYLKNNDKYLNYIKDILNFEKFNYLFDIINELHNSFKHNILTSSLRSQIISKTPSICLIGYGKNKIGDIGYAANNFNDLDHTLISGINSKDRDFYNLIFINCNFNHIIDGFEDFLKDFCNIEKFESNHRIITLKKEVDYEK